MATLVLQFAPLWPSALIAAVIAFALVQNAPRRGGKPSSGRIAMALGQERGEPARIYLMPLSFRR